MKTYEITNVSDFLKVPKDRRGACLIEFSAWIELAEATVEFTEACGAHSTPFRFDWIDDGKLEKSVHFEISKPKNQPTP